MDADGRDPEVSRCWSRFLPPADHVSASRPGEIERLHRFDEFFRLARGSFIAACINWRFSRD
jgi:hypothetical protein